MPDAPVSRGRAVVWKSLRPNWCTIRRLWYRRHERPNATEHSLRHRRTKSFPLACIHAIRPTDVKHKDINQQVRNNWNLLVEIYLEKHFHRLGTGVFGGLMNWIVTIVARSTWTGTEFGNLCFFLVVWLFVYRKTYIRANIYEIRSEQLVDSSMSLGLVKSMPQALFCF